MLEHGAPSSPHHAAAAAAAAYPDRAREFGEGHRDFSVQNVDRFSRKLVAVEANFELHTLVADLFTFEGVFYFDSP